MVSVRLMIASGALWCVAGIGAGMWRSNQDSAQEAAAESPGAVLVAFESKADRLPLPEPAAAFGQRFPPVMIEAEPEAGVPPGLPPKYSQYQAHKKAYATHMRRSGGLCSRHGLRKVWVSSRRWRCR